MYLCKIDTCLSVGRTEAQLWLAAPVCEHTQWNDVPSVSGQARRRHIEVSRQTTVQDRSNGETMDLTKTLIYTTIIGELSSKCEEFLVMRSQFDSDHGVHVANPRPLCDRFLHFIVRCFLRKKNNAALHFMPCMNAVFALDVATALRQINR